MRLNRVLVAAVSLASIATSVSSQERIRVMFLGDSGHHIRPREVVGGPRGSGFRAEEDCSREPWTYRIRVPR